MSVLNMRLGAVDRARLDQMKEYRNKLLGDAEESNDADGIRLALALATESLLASGEALGLVERLGSPGSQASPQDEGSKDV